MSWVFLKREREREREKRDWNKHSKRREPPDVAGQVLALPCRNLMS
jgi:hypothetical protein